MFIRLIISNRLTRRQIRCQKHCDSGRYAQTRAIPACTGPSGLRTAPQHRIYARAENCSDGGNIIATVAVFLGFASDSALQRGARAVWCCMSSNSRYLHPSEFNSCRSLPPRKRPVLVRHKPLLPSTPSARSRAHVQHSLHASNRCIASGLKC